jgi:hypothetical protein
MATDDLRQLNLVADVRDEPLTTDQLAALLQMRRSTVEDFARRGCFRRSSSADTAASSEPTCSTLSTGCDARRDVRPSPAPSWKIQNDETAP